LKEKIIWREPESGTREILEQALDDANILKAIPAPLELGSIESIKSAVESNLGVSILPQLTIKKELENNVLHTVAVSDINFTRKLMMVRKSRRFHKQITKKFVKFILEKW